MGLSNLLQEHKQDSKIISLDLNIFLLFKVITMITISSSFNPSHKIWAVKTVH